MKPTAGQRVFGVFNAASMLVFCILCIYPLVLVTALSFNDGVDAMRGGIYLWPRVWSLENYRTILTENRILTSALISIYRTVAGASLAMLLNACFAYALTKRDLPGRRVFTWFILSRTAANDSVSRRSLPHSLSAHSRTRLRSSSG